MDYYPLGPTLFSLNEPCCAELEAPCWNQALFNRLAEGLISVFSAVVLDFHPARTYMHDPCHLLFRPCAHPRASFAPRAPRPCPRQHSRPRATRRAGASGAARSPRSRQVLLSLRRSPLIMFQRSSPVAEKLAFDVEASPVPSPSRIVITSPSTPLFSSPAPVGPPRLPPWRSGAGAAPGAAARFEGRACARLPRGVANCGDSGRPCRGCCRAALLRPPVPRLLWRCLAAAARAVQHCA